MRQRKQGESREEGIEDKMTKCRRIADALRADPEGEGPIASEI